MDTPDACRTVAHTSCVTVLHVLAITTLLVLYTHPWRVLSHTTRPDVVLLTGGTDGGNAEPVLRAARQLVACGWRGPVVVAGNVDAQAEVAGILEGAPVVLAENVLPRIGILAPDSARAAIREMFLAHVIGGKHLSRRTDFTAMVRGATPDVVLTGVELLARGLGPEHPGAGDVAAVDVGGATTDVHSVVTPDPETEWTDREGLAREVVATAPVTRTVEGDLGMRWSAPSTVDAAGQADLTAAAARRRDEPGYLPDSAAEADVDEAIAQAAVGLALRRHAGRARVVVGPDGRVVERTGKDLREVELVVASGGVFRHGRSGVAGRALSASIGPDPDGGWQLPRAARVVVDTDHVLAAAGLLAGTHPTAAYRLVMSLTPRL
ncbi:MAG: glutamate mutase L [Nocardioides sp.]